MTALTNDRLVNEIEEGGPQGYKAGSPCPQGFQTYYGQLITQGTDGYLYPALPSSFSMTGSVVVGIGQVSNFLIGPNTPLRTPYMQVRFGVFDFANDAGNPVVAGTLPNTLLYAVDDQTLSLSSNGGTRPIAGRLWAFNSSDAFPVKALIGTTVSGSAA